VSQFIANRVLGHSLHGLERIYDRNSYLDEKAEALEAWGDYLRRVVGEAGENVRAIG
jgi:hypothetical protein